MTRILPLFLTDFFPPQDIMNKVIGEFLSSQQPHPTLMAGVVFKVSCLSGYLQNLVLFKNSPFKPIYQVSCFTLKLCLLQVSGICKLLY